MSDECFYCNGDSGVQPVPLSLANGGSVPLCFKCSMDVDSSELVRKLDEVLVDAYVEDLVDFEQYKDSLSG